jgi:hypothetical protein
VIAKLFSSSENLHPLADPKAIKAVLAELPAGDDLKAIDELTGWFESLCNADNIRPEQLLPATRQLDEAGQGLLRRIVRAYLITPPTERSRADEQRVWSLCGAYFHYCGLLYGTLCAAGAPQGEVKSEARKSADLLRPHLPVLFGRQIAALAALGKWRHFHYERLPGEFWQRLGAAYLGSERLGLASKPVGLYPGLPETTSAQQYTQFLVFEASSPDSLLPLEIEIAEKVIAYFAPLFVLGPGNRADNVYWIDAGQGNPPLRLVVPPSPAATVRLLALGRAPEALSELVRTVERGEVPANLALGGQYPARAVLRVLQHLAAYWAPQPPLRQHKRHLVKTGSLRALQGFEGCLSVVRGQPRVEEAETWQVENVSLGGFGAALPSGRRELLRIGELVALQPEGGDNWLIAIVRRYGRDRDTQSAGLQTLSKQAAPLLLRVCGSQRYGADGGVPAILLDDASQENAVRVLLPATTFDLSESYDSKVAGRSALLSPIELLEAGRDYQIGRYRLRYAD